MMDTLATYASSSALIVLTTFLLAGCGEEPVATPLTPEVPDRLYSSHATCGMTLTSDFQLTADLTCAPGFTGNVFTIGADGIELDGGGHTITAPDAHIVQIVGRTGVTVKDFVVNGGSPGTSGIGLRNVFNSTIENVTINNRDHGVFRISGDAGNNTFRNNTFRGHSQAGMHITGSGHLIEGNDLGGNSGTWSLIIQHGGPSTITPDNNFAGSGGGISFRGDGLILEDIDFPDDLSTAIVLGGSNITVRRVDASGTGGRGIDLRGIQNSTFDNVTITGREHAFRTHTFGGDVGNTVINSTITDNVHGIDLSGTTNTVRGNDLRRNGTAVRLRLAGAGSTIAPDNVFDESSTAIQLVRADGFVLDGLTLPASVGVAISPHGTGVTFRNLVIQGSGSGLGFSIRGLTDSDFENVKISGRERAIEAHRSSHNDDLRFTGNDFSNNTDGVWLNGDRSVWTGNVLDGNAIRGIWLLGGTGHQILQSQLTNNTVGLVSATPGSVDIHQSVIAGNVDWGVANQRTDMVVDARNNDWGDPTGPLDDDVQVDGQNDALGLTNPDGLGDAVTDFVLYDPWVGKDPCDMSRIFEEIDGLLADGLINGGQASSMRSKVSNAESLCSEGKALPAASILDALIGEVAAFENAGKITSFRADSVIAVIEDVKAGMSN